MTFNDKDQFRNFVYDNICQCFNQCIDLNEKTFLKTQSVCSEIVYQSNNNNFDIIINNAINYFIKSGIIFKNGIRYYLTENNMKFTWDNIKTITNIETRQLLWLLRKLIVDCLLKGLLYENINLKIFSVGSTNLTSDYDITLYGSDKNKIYIIENFNKKFYDIFSDSSSLVFDTNIYGKAYIAFSENDFGINGDVIKCKNQEFFYLKSGNDNSQICWALVKYINDIRDSFGENIYNDLIDFMMLKLQSNLLNYATIIRRTLKNKDESFNYNKMLGYQNKIINFYNNTDKITGYNDYISLVNFYGIETYFTRGAFLDIVVNGQMCGSKSIELTDVDYLCSILENAGFFFNHNNKTKYVVRVNKTLEKLIDKNNLYNIPEIKELDTIINNFKIEDNGKVDYDKSYCKWINDDTFDLLKCEKYEIFNILFKLIYKLLKVYTENNQIYDNEFIFYNIFINNNNNENSISPALQHFSNKNRNRSLSSAIKNILD